MKSARKEHGGFAERLQQPTSRPGADEPESYFGQTDASGRTILQFPFPTLNEQSLAALVIRAQAAESLGELRYQLKPKRPGR